jgi:signal transduction histidine kinase
MRYAHQDIELSVPVITEDTIILRNFSAEISPVTNSIPRPDNSSLRKQFVIPLGITILAIAIAITWLTRWAVNDARRREITGRFDSVHSQIEQASYPLTPSVLSQIRRYSGTELVLLGTDGSVRDTSLGGDATTQLKKLLPELPRPTGQVTLEAMSFHYQFYDTGESTSPASGTARRSLLLLQPDEPQKSAAHAIMLAPAVSGFISVLGMMLVTGWVAGGLVKRIHVLEQQVQQLAHGNFHTIELPGPNDALRRLAQSVNSLSQQLSVARDVIARTERARLVSMIASGMAHSLRNSLTGAGLLLQSYLRTQQGSAPEELVMAQNQLHQAADAVKRLLAADPKTELSDEPDETLGHVHQTLLDCVQSYAKHLGVTFQLRLGDYRNEPSVGGLHDFLDADEQLMRLSADWLVPQGAAVAGALVNLCMNAMEAAGPGGTVECHLLLDRHRIEEMTGHQFQWNILDTGPGPPEDIAGTIMEPFVSSKLEGIGLGLAMAKRIATRCAGHLTWRRSHGLTVFEFQVRHNRNGNLN